DKNHPQLVNINSAFLCISSSVLADTSSLAERGRFSCLTRNAGHESGCNNTSTYWLRAVHGSSNKSTPLFSKCSIELSRRKFKAERKCSRQRWFQPACPPV